MMKLTNLIGAAVIVGALLVAHSAAKNKMASEPNIGAPAPLFTLQDQNGKQVNLADFTGKIVVLEWFNNECPFVQKQYTTGNMNGVAQKYAAKDVVWLAINSTNGKTNADNKQIAGEWNMNRPILNDASGKVGHAYDSKNTPTMYIIDKQGNLAYWGAIDNKPVPDPKAIDGSTNYVAKALDEMLAGQSVSEPRTKPYGCSVKYAE
jgi:peroxiredoxin